MLMCSYLQERPFLDISKRLMFQKGIVEKYNTKFNVKLLIQCKTFLYSAHACYDLKNLCQLKSFILLQ